MVGERVKVQVLESGVQLLEVFAVSSEGVDLLHLVPHSVLGDVLHFLWD